MSQDDSNEDFLNDDDERNHLNDVIRGAIESKEEVDLRDLYRMKQLLEKEGADNGSIVLQEHWAIYYQAIGDSTSEITHLRRHLDLLRELFETNGPISPYDIDFASECFRVLSDRLEKIGERVASIEVLNEAKHWRKRYAS